MPNAIANEKETEINNETIRHVLSFTGNDEDYHDKLCHMIDSLINELKLLKEKEFKLEKDKHLYENLVMNLTGHTQRLQRNEIALYNKKKEKKLNKFSIMK